MNIRFIRNIFKHICISAGSVLLAVNVNAQTNQFDVISKKLEEYSKTHAQEKVFLHTDKSFYLAGEIVWFKQYVVNADDHKLKGISKLSYVEIIDKSGRAVDQAKIFLNNGLGTGSFQLANSLNSGVYILRAYTNWMKNNDASFFFEQPITENPDLEVSTSEQSTIQNETPVSGISMIEQFIKQRNIKSI